MTRNILAALFTASAVSAVHVQQNWDKIESIKETLEENPIFTVGLHASYDLP